MRETTLRGGRIAWVGAGGRRRGGSHLLDGGYCDDEKQGEAAGDGAGRGVNDHLAGEKSTCNVRPQH